MWWALSRAGHHHYYELSATAAELIRLRDELVDLLGLLRSLPVAGDGDVVSRSS